MTGRWRPCVQCMRCRRQPGSKVAQKRKNSKGGSGRRMRSRRIVIVAQHRGQHEVVALSMLYKRGAWQPYLQFSDLPTPSPTTSLFNNCLDRYERLPRMTIIFQPPAQQTCPAKRDRYCPSVSPLAFVSANQGTIPKPALARLSKRVCFDFRLVCSQ
jgi:hypothetical protein